jgi:hypothetical protein
MVDYCMVGRSDKVVNNQLLNNQPEKINSLALFFVNKRHPAALDLSISSWMSSFNFPLTYLTDEKATCHRLLAAC